MVYQCNDSLFGHIHRGIFIQNNLSDIGLSLRPQGNSLLSWAQSIELVPTFRGTLYLRMETESSLRNVVSNKNTTMDNVQKVSHCVNLYDHNFVITISVTCSSYRRSFLEG
jgi:hypothetical protein